MRVVAAFNLRGVVIEASHELEGARPIAKPKPAANGNGGRVARSLRAGAWIEAHILVEVVLPRGFQRDDVLAREVVDAVDGEHRDADCSTFSTVAAGSQKLASC